MKIELELTKDEALALAAELHRSARRVRGEATYSLVQGSKEPLTRLVDEADLYQRLSSAIFGKAL